MIRNIAALTQFEALVAKVEDSHICKHAVIRISPSLEVKVEQLTWSELVSLEARDFEFTAAKVVAVAKEQFFDNLCVRFGISNLLVNSLDAGASHMHRSRTLVEVMGRERVHWIEEAQMRVLRELSDGMVERIAQIHGIVAASIHRNIQGLEVGNVRDFMHRIEQEAHDVYGVYLGEHDIQEKYRLLICTEPPVEEIVQFINEDLAAAQIHVRIPVEAERDPSRPHFSEVMYLELITSHLIYKLPTVSEQERSQIRLKLYIQGHGLVTYRIEPEIDLWSGLIAYRFTPTDKMEAPDILSVRGTQRRSDLAGFLASMISIWHPLGPGGNALSGAGAKMLEEKIRKDGRPVILAGHSMGAEIAVALAKKKSIEGLVERTYSFSNPGRNKHHMNGQSRAAKVHHFVSASDPVAHLGDFRDGRVNLIYSHEVLIPEGIREMIHQAHSIILNNHCIPQTLGKRAWMALELRPGACIGKFNPVWGFLHRLVSNTLYGPWKMIAIVSWVALPVFQQLATWAAKGCYTLYTWTVLPIRSIWNRHEAENRVHPNEGVLRASS
jgi:hypothetical protein